MMAVHVLTLLAWMLSSNVGPSEPAQVRQSAARGSSAAVSSLVSTPCGFLWVENRKKSAFSVLLASPSAQKVEVPGASWFIVDDVLLEVSVTDAETIGVPKARGASLLRKYVDWEADFVAKAKGWRDIDRSAHPVNMGLRDAVTMMWGYDAPAPIDIVGQKVTRMMYVPTAVDDVVFVVTAPMRAKEDLSNVADVIKRSLVTLHRFNHRLEDGEIRDLSTSTECRSR